MAKWIINKGWHSSLSNFWLRLVPKWNNGKPVTYKFKMSGDNWYPYKEPDDHDVNKFFGFSMGLHHKDSIRLGWAPNFNKRGSFNIYFYLYNNGARFFSRFTKINADTDYTITISVDFGYVTFELFDQDGNSIAKSSERFSVPDKKIGYYLWFCFGGNKPAPKEMTAWLTKN